MTSESPKPYVQVACVCEKALVEPDTVASLIRIVDTYFIETPDLPEGFGTALPLTIVVFLKSGDVVGEHQVGLQLHGPDGKTKPAKFWPLMFNGGESGVNLKVIFTLKSPKFGLYWFDVRWGDEVLTRIPLRITQRITDPTAKVAESIETEPRQS